jgi:AbrB family looped-hinge helix DNA binding protein
VSVFGFTKKPLAAGAGTFVCKLDSKARLVLPVSIRSKLNLSSGDFVSLRYGGNGSIELSKSSLPSKILRNSRNSWEAVELV